MKPRRRRFHPLHGPAQLIGDAAIRRTPGAHTKRHPAQSHASSREGRGARNALPAPPVAPEQEHSHGTTAYQPRAHNALRHGLPVLFGDRLFLASNLETMPGRLPTASDLPANVICSIVPRKMLTPLLPTIWLPVPRRNLVTHPSYVLATPDKLSRTTASLRLLAKLPLNAICALAYRIKLADLGTAFCSSAPTAAHQCPDPASRHWRH